MTATPANPTPLLTDITSLLHLLDRTLPENTEHRDLLATCENAVHFLTRHMPADELAEEAAVIRDLLLDIACRASSPIA